MTLLISETKDIPACRALRGTVFIHEQGVSVADELDDQDENAIHLLATLDGTPIGTARLLVHGTIGKIGRVCVLSDHRGTGIGAALIRQALVSLRKDASLTTARLGSQTHAIPFYEGLGFTAHGAIYDDAGIPHRDMDHTL